MATAYSALLGLGHGVSDAAAGLLLGGIAAAGSPSQVGIAILLYNGLAFGCQPVAGLLIDRLRCLRPAAVGGLLSSGAALLALLAGAPPLAAAALAGLGSALYHAGGGGLALDGSSGHAGAVGLFVAPGVLGLAIGGWQATNPAAPWAACALLAGLAAMLARLYRPRLRQSAPGVEQAGPHLGWEGLEGAVLLLLLAVSLRSGAWTAYQVQFTGSIRLLLLLAGSAAAGKLLGGWVADRLGWRRWIFLALLCGSILLSAAGASLAALLAGVCLIQATTPVLLAAMGRAIPNGPATAAGLVLGLGTLIGGLPALAGEASQFTRPVVLIPSLLLAAVAFWGAGQLAGTANRAEVVRLNY